MRGVVDGDAQCRRRGSTGAAGHDAGKAVDNAAGNDVAKAVHNAVHNDDGDDRESEAANR